MTYVRRSSAYTLSSPWCTLSPDSKSAQSIQYPTKLPRSKVFHEMLRDPLGGFHASLVSYTEHEFEQIPPLAIL